MLMRLRATLKERGRSVSSHYRDIQDGLFTRPVRLGKRAVGWPAEDVEKLNAARRAGLSDNQIREIVDDLHFKRAFFRRFCPISTYGCPTARHVLITGTFPKQKLVLDA